MPTNSCRFDMVQRSDMLSPRCLTSMWVPYMMDSWWYEYSVEMRIVDKGSAQHGHTPLSLPIAPSRRHSTILVLYPPSRTHTLTTYIRAPTSHPSAPGLRKLPQPSTVNRQPPIPISYSTSYGPLSSPSPCLVSLLPRLHLPTSPLSFPRHPITRSKWQTPSKPTLS